MRFQLLIPLLLASFLLGCNSRKEEVPPWEKKPWDGLTAEERDRSAMAAIQKSEKFSGARCRWLKHGAHLLAWPSETHLLKAAAEEGIITMVEVGTGNRIGKPEPAWRITITESGKDAIADCKVTGGSGDDWGIPVSRRKLLNAKYVSEGPMYSGVTIYEAEWQWEPTAVGEKVKHELTDHMKVEEGRYRGKVYLKYLSSTKQWYVDQIEERGAERLD